MLNPSIWRRWGHRNHPGISVIVAGALIVTAFGLEIYDADVNPPKLSPFNRMHADRIIAADFA